MGNDLKKSVEKPEDHNEVDGTIEAQNFETQNTEELPEVMILDEADPAAGATSEATGAVTGSGEDEVYVILPEGDTCDIPVVETQVLDDSGLDAAALETGDLAASETSAIGEELTDVFTPPVSELVDESIEARETQNLDELTNELNDQVLADSAGMTSEILPVADVPIQDTALAGDSDGTQVVSMPAGRRWVVGLASAAAFLAMAAGGMWYFGGWSSSGVEYAGGGSGADTPPVVATTTGVPPDSSGGDPGAATTVQSLSPSELEAKASKELFRGKLLAALELGFAGEVKNE